MPRARIAIDRGPGATVVLLHPFPLGPNCFEPIVQRMEADYRIVVPDLRELCLRASSLPDHPATIDRLALALADALDAAQITPSSVLGVSMGGYVALALAAERVDLVPTLALSDTRARADSDAERAAREQLSAALIAAGSGAAALLARVMIPRLLSQEAPDALRSQVRAWVEAAPLEAVLQALSAMASRPSRESDLRLYPHPILALCGEQDPGPTKEEMQAMVSTLPSATFRIIARSGHLPFLEQPERFCDEFSGWLAACLG